MQGVIYADYKIYSDLLFQFTVVILDKKVYCYTVTVSMPYLPSQVFDYYI